jgi:hypothetical protein
MLQRVFDFIRLCHVGVEDIQGYLAFLRRCFQIVRFSVRQNGAENTETARRKVQGGLHTETGASAGNPQIAQSCFPASVFRRPNSGGGPQRHRDGHGLL